MIITFKSQKTVAILVGLFLVFTSRWQPIIWIVTWILAYSGVSMFLPLERNEDGSPLRSSETAANGP